MYTIGQVSKMLNIPATTLRYYDSYGLFPSIKRNAGKRRIFTENEIEILKIVECLKISGMEMKDIKTFLLWCNEGDKSLQNRRDMFYERKEAVTEQIKKLRHTLDVIEYKCWYYDTAVEHKSEKYVESLTDQEIPDKIVVTKKSMRKF